MMRLCNDSLIPQFPVFSIGGFLSGKQPGILFIQILDLRNLLHAKFVKAYFQTVFKKNRDDAGRMEEGKRETWGSPEQIPDPCAERLGRDPLGRGGNSGVNSRFCTELDCYYSQIRLWSRYNRCCFGVKKPKKSALCGVSSSQHTKNNHFIY